MKQNLLSKLLLLMAVMLFGATGAFAADETITFSELYESNTVLDGVAIAPTGKNFSITFAKENGSTAPQYYTTGAAVRLYAKGTMTVSSSTKTITKIELTFGTGEGSNAITTDVVTYSNGTWTGSAQSVKFTVGGTSGHRRIKAVAVTYGVAAPTLPASQDFVGSMQVEITNNDNDATVYYTTDGSTPDANSTEYTESFTITETTTVKAIAIKGNDASDVVTRTYTKTKVDIATITGISPTTVNEGDAGTFTLAATFADGTEAGRDYKVSWTSDDEDVLMVEDGEYLALAAGTANVTVSVTVLDDSKYYEVSETFTVTVKEPFVAATYELVTDASTLAAGDEIVIAYVKADGTTVKVLSTTQNANNRAAVDAELNDDGTLTIGADAQVINLTKDGDWFKFDVNGGYLYAAGGTSDNYLRTTKDATDNKAQATISIDSDGNATINFNLTGNSPRNQMRYNTSNKMFACYASTANTSNMPMPQIYRRVQDAPQTVTITIGEHGYASYCGDKNLDFSATELKAYAVTQVENGVMILTEFEDGYKAGEGAVLKGAEGEYQVPVATTATAVAGNMLIGNNSDEAITVEADGTTYRFGYSPAAQKVGFMKATSNFTVASGKAYLKINSTNNAPAFLSFDGTATGIDAANVSTTAADGQRYNLNGQRVNSNYRGVVIVDGKKLIQK